MNAVYLQHYGWYRIDARGNKEGVAAEFTPPIEQLAFGLKWAGECDMPGYFASPHDRVVHLLTSCTTVQEVFDRLEEGDFTA